MEGVAKIKSEFVITDHERTLSLNCVSEADKTKFDSVKEDDVDKSNSSESNRAKNKKWGKKLKGQNKNRSAFKLPSDKQLCSRVLHQEKDSISGCGNKNCQFLHDVKEYLKVKPADLGNNCYLYETKGKCPWGIACRFGSCHIDEEGKNKENPQTTAEYESNKHLLSENKVSYDILVALRKRKYDFSQSVKVIQAVDKLCKRTNDDSELEEARKRERNDTFDNDCEDGGVKKIKFENGAEQRSKAEEPLNSNEDGNESGVEGTKTYGPIDDSDLIKLRPSEKKKIDWANKLYLAPLTTLGNIPFRRICKEYGADVTCGEMTLATSLLQGDTSEWSLVKRHGSEDFYGVQIAGNNPAVLTKACQVLRETCELDFIDVNLGCPIDDLYRQGIGSGMLMRPRLLKHTALSLNTLMDIPFTFKVRMGCKKPMVHNYMPWMKESGLSLITIHGRTRDQRYTKFADWNFVEDCAKKAFPVPVFGNGDILSFEDYERVRAQCPTMQGAMIGRGALMKPWIFQEIKERRHMDPSSTDRMDMLKKYVNYGLDHWGSDNRGVENTRRFLLEWLSFLHRYVPLGLLVDPPQIMNQRPPFYRGRNDLETLMGSPNAQDWVKISEMLLGPVPEGFVFLPKHKANAWK